MKRKVVSVVYDRRKEVETKGAGNVEIIIRLTRLSVKKIIVNYVTPSEWEEYKDSAELRLEVAKYEKIVSAMELLKEEMTVDNFNKHIGVATNTAQARKEKEEKKIEDVKEGSFLDFMRDEIVKERCKESTRRQKLVTLDALARWGGIVTFADLTSKKLRAFDEWLREDGTRSDVAVYNYHKRMKKFVRFAFERGIIEKNPYDTTHFKRGKCKERKPLTENELLVLRNLNLSGKEDRVRDLFIFAAYTGLAFCDVQAFDFFKMTEKSGDLYYIDGSRMKTGSNFFTPILKPAMDVLKKYNFVLPKISNQKANDYLHLLESRANINKSLTFHVARHSFATLSLSHDVPIEKVARMLGHQDIKTTQIYAKILKSTIERHSVDLSKAII
jgi:site-specific recombinase XerD